MPEVHLPSFDSIALYVRIDHIGDCKNVSQTDIFPKIGRYMFQGWQEAIPDTIMLHLEEGDYTFIFVPGWGIAEEGFVTVLGCDHESDRDLLNYIMEHLEPILFAWSLQMSQWTQ